MTTCQCQKPLVNAHGCCGYCGKGIVGTLNADALQEAKRDYEYKQATRTLNVCEHCGQPTIGTKVICPIDMATGYRVLLHEACLEDYEKVKPISFDFKNAILEAARRINAATEPLPTSEPINEVMLPPSGAMENGLMEFLACPKCGGKTGPLDCIYDSEVMCRKCFGEHMARPALARESQYQPCALCGQTDYPTDSLPLCNGTFAVQCLGCHHELKVRNAERGKPTKPPQRVHHTTLAKIYDDLRNLEVLSGEDIEFLNDWAGKVGMVVAEVEKFTPKDGDLISICGPAENREEMLHAASMLNKRFPGVDFLVSPNDVVVSSERKSEHLTHATARWRDCLEVIEQTYKRHPNGVGVPQESIRGNALYVLDWRPDEPKRMDAVKVEHVVSVDADGTVNMVGSVTDLETFASLVVGGPFPLEVESDGDE